MVKHTPHKVMRQSPIQKKGQPAITTINLMVVKQLMVNAIIRHFSPLHIKTLPLNSYAVVTNLHNNRKVIVRINDRGPFSEKRIIDLSHSAAKELGLIARGTGQVRIEALHVDHKGQISGAGAKTLTKHAKTQEASDRLVINKNNEKKNQNLDSTNDAKTVFKLKLLALSSKNQAESIITKLALDDIKTEINQNGQNYEIHFGPIADQADINQLKTKLQKNDQWTARNRLYL